jgi:CheY-like chemotaxis protein
VLERLRGDADFRRLPIVMFTSSREDQDRLRSYDLGVNAFVTKPIGFDELSLALRTIHSFWELAELPDWQSTRRSA